MTREELIDTLVDLEWEYADHEEQSMNGVAFRKQFNGDYVKYHLSDEGIKRANKESIIKQLNSHNVSHLTRIVGYYSRVHNWNKSKLGELKDRQKGEYVI
jgi:hypothetical protein